ncbi:hypothetical protein K438DRAFT_600668 [Mycena galopus ATCC 62051]|nr:hypothetical protein K438DRAFT_600668 [Mycena galopus ATCC 62051]
MSWLRFIRCASRARDELTRKVIQTALRRYQRPRIPLFTGHPLSPPTHTLSCAALQMHPPSLFLTWDATASPSTRSQCRLATPSGELLLPNPLESRPPFAFIRSPFPRYGYGPLCNTTEAACPVPIPLIQDVFVHLAILLGIDHSLRLFLFIIATPHQIVMPWWRDIQPRPRGVPTSHHTKIPLSPSIARPGAYPSLALKHRSTTRKVRLDKVRPRNPYSTQ